MPVPRRPLETLAYPLAAVRAALRQRPFTATLTIDGRRRRVRRVMQVALGSGRYYGGGMRVTDAAEATDGYRHIDTVRHGDMMTQ